MSLTLIIGPMFSGKTTELLRIIERAEAIGQSSLVINHSIDIRYTDSSAELPSSVSTHTRRSHDCIPLSSLSDLLNESTEHSYKELFQKASFIAINEGQFFTDLFENVLKMIEVYKKDVVVCGLDGDYLRNPFENMMRLIPVCDTLIRLTSLCSICRSGKEAIHSKRMPCIDELRPHIKELWTSLEEHHSSESSSSSPMKWSMKINGCTEGDIDITVSFHRSSELILSKQNIFTIDNIDEILYLLDCIWKYQSQYLGTLNELYETSRRIQHYIQHYMSHKRISNIKVGGIAEYQPVCRKCYLG
jgi:thymidine kinase